MTAYQKIIADMVPPTYNPRHIEAFMRLEHPALDGLSKRQFRSECATAMICIDQGGTELAGELAASFGL